MQAHIDGDDTLTTARNVVIPALGLAALGICGAITLAVSDVIKLGANVGGIHMALAFAMALCGLWAGSLSREARRTASWIEQTPKPKFCPQRRVLLGCRHVRSNAIRLDPIKTMRGDFRRLVAAYPTLRIEDKAAFLHGIAVKSRGAFILLVGVAAVMLLRVALSA
jgi:hypothetical protein